MSVLSSSNSRIWAQSKSTVYFNIILISVVNIIGLIMLIIYWAELSVLYQVILLSSLFLSMPFLGMYVTGMRLNKDSIQFFLPHKKVRQKLSDIKSARVLKKMGNDYLELRTTKAIGFRKRFHFQIINNHEQIVEILNILLSGGVQVYSNPSLETTVKFNSNTKRFDRVLGN
jgi:uncharacterized membrane protein YfbV (UPF0208 family)